MSLLKRLFKPKVVKTPSLDSQLQALEQQTAEQLLATAKGGSNDALREAAIQRLSFSQELVNMADEEGSRWPILARKRLGQLLEEGEVTLDNLSQTLSDPKKLLGLASYSHTATAQLIDQTQDENLLLQLASDGSTTQVRQAAAARISSRTQLEQLCKLAQSKDKSVYKLARARLDVFKAGDARTAEARANMASICDKLEKLARLEADTIYKARITLLENEWMLLAESANAELAQRYEQALASCHRQIAARAEQIAQVEEEQRLDQQAVDVVNQAHRDIHQLLLELYELDDNTRLPQYQQQLNDLVQVVRLASQRPVDFGKSLGEFERAQRYLLYWLEHLAQAGSLVELRRRNETLQIHTLLEAAREFYRKELPASLETVAVELAQWEKQQQDAKTAAQRLEQELADLARRGLWAARDGLVRKARGIHKEIGEKVQRLPHRSATLQARLDELDEAIARLSDWHEFAVTPKKEALVEHMRALKTSSLAPQDLASKIHELQDEWKSLSKGIQQADESLWHSFQEASQEAYAPCREFFDAQAREREQNLTHRHRLIDQLTLYLQEYHWDTPVWNDVEKTLKVARQEWQTYWPVPRKAGEELQSRFDPLMDELHSRLKAHYQENKTQKQALISEAQACVSDENLPAAIERIKQLQQRWKTLGKTYPRDDQQLWQAFRRECDAVFARRNEQQVARQEAQSAQVNAARELIAQLQTLAALSHEELTAAREQINEIKAAFHQLDDLPKDATKELQQAFNQQLKLLENQRIQGRNQAEIRSWQDLYNLADQLRRLELAYLQGNDNREAVEQVLANPPRLPAAGLAQLQSRAAALSHLTPADQAHNQHRLQLLCIRAEILSGQETPAEDKALRMNYQMQQLQQGLGQRDQNLEDLVIEWIGVGGVEDGPYATLFARFMQSLARQSTP